jgi:glycosyltransferase involved in cell wall biosynthesis
MGYLCVSVVTVCFNAVKTLQGCIQSIRRQSYQAEHIVIDGGSSDGSRELLQAQQSGIARLVMEPDRGMYDALNKGIGLATGDVVGILHADDIYAHGEVLANVVRALEASGAESCYGDLEYVHFADVSRVVRRWRAGAFRLEAFYWGWMPPHPTFFVRRSVYERFGSFLLDLGTAADYELMLRFLLKHRISTAYIPEVLVRMRLGGKSTVSLGARLRANDMDRKAWRVNDLRPYPWTIPLKPLRKLPQFLRSGLLWRMLLNRGG